MARVGNAKSVAIHLASIRKILANSEGTFPIDEILKASGKSTKLLALNCGNTGPSLMFRAVHFGRTEIGIGGRFVYAT